MSDIQSLTSQVERLGYAVSWWNTAIIVMMFVAAVAAAGLVVTQYIAFKKSKHLTEIQAELGRLKDNQLAKDLRDKDEKIALADGRAAEAIKKAQGFQLEIAYANQRASEANEAAERERIERIKLEGRVAWRRITSDQKSTISFRLKRFGGQFVRLEYNGGDIEGGTFAMDIALTLKMASWFVPYRPGSFLRGVDMNAPFGIETESGVEIDSTGDDASRSAADGLVHELIFLGYDAINKGVKRKFPPDARPVVYVVINPRPEGAQGEAKLRQNKPVTK